MYDFQKVSHERDENIVNIFLLVLIFLVDELM